MSRERSDRHATPNTWMTTKRLNIWLGMNLMSDQIKTTEHLANAIDALGNAVDINTVWLFVLTLAVLWIAGKVRANGR